MSMLNLVQGRLERKSKSWPRFFKEQKQGQKCVGKSQIIGGELMDWTIVINSMASALNQNRLQIK